MLLAKFLEHSVSERVKGKVGIELGAGTGILRINSLNILSEILYNKSIIGRLFWGV